MSHDPIFKMEDFPVDGLTGSWPYCRWALSTGILKNDLEKRPWQDIEEFFIIAKDLQRMYARKPMGKQSFRG